jgi:hypothetical protein
MTAIVISACSGSSDFLHLTLDHPSALSALLCDLRLLPKVAFQKCHPWQDSGWSRPMGGTDIKIRKEGKKRRVEVFLLNSLLLKDVLLHYFPI